MVVNPSSAVIAKARAKYGRRLTDKDYASMIKLSSVSEVASYLQSYTYYRHYLSAINTQDVHRGYVEHILREELFKNYLSLCRYNANNSPVTGFIMRQSEIDQIMRYLTLLSIGRPEEYLFSMPLYFDEHTDIDLKLLSGCRTYDEFLDSISNTRYRRLLTAFRPVNGKLDLSGIESALDNDSFRELYDDISKLRSKKQKQTLYSLFDTIADYNNYSRIIRLKRYYDADNTQIKRYLMPFGNIKGKRLDDILLCGSYEEVSDALRHTRIGKKISSKQMDVTNRISTRSRYELCRHNLYFSQDPEVVLLAYYILSDVELSNVICIIEGVRYSLDANDIKELLIL